MQHFRQEPHHVRGVQPELFGSRGGGEYVRDERTFFRTRAHQSFRARCSCLQTVQLLAHEWLPYQEHSLRVTRWNLSGGTHLAGWPASAAASLSISLLGAAAV